MLNLYPGYRILHIISYHIISLHPVQFVHTMTYPNLNSIFKYVNVTGKQWQTVQFPIHTDHNKNIQSASKIIVHNFLRPVFISPYQRYIDELTHISSKTITMFVVLPKIL